MTNEQVIPVEIKLHQKSHVLSIEFSDGLSFNFPVEYLRVNSPAAEVRTQQKPVIAPANINIDRLEPQGSYAIRIIFDDGHDTGIYSWETFYNLGVNQEKNWQDYLDKLAAAGLSRDAKAATDATTGSEKNQYTVLYFAYLAEKMRTEAEEVTPPQDINTVESFMNWLRRMKREKGYLLADDAVRVTVNKQFTEAFTRLDSGDEIAIVPVSPTPPAPPQN